MVEPDKPMQSIRESEREDAKFPSFTGSEPQPPSVPQGITKHRGFIAVLDVLGARDVTDPVEFLRRWDSLGEETRREIQRVDTGSPVSAMLVAIARFLATSLITSTKGGGDAGEAGNFVKRMNEPSLRFRVIADTIVISTDDYEGFSFLESVLSKVFIKGLSLRLFLRGTISFGDFWETEDMLVGPAVSDAFNWNDQMEWIGVALTPTAGYAIERKDAHNASDWIGSFVHYDVPLKDRRVPLYALDWTSETEAPSRDDLTKSFSQQPIPIKAEVKYRHTLEFFDRVSGTKPPLKWLTMPAGGSPSGVDSNDNT